MSMHCCVVITRADAVGGATIHVRDVARRLMADGMRATVLVGGTGPVTDQLEHYGIPYESLRWLGRAIHPVRDLRAAMELRAALRRLRPDVVSSHTAKAGMLARVAARAAGIPVIYTPHGWAITDRLSRRAGQVFKMVERAAAPLSSAIVNVCEAERDLALRHGVGKAGQHRVVHNGVFDVGLLFRAIPALPNPRIVSVARMEAPKDHATLLEALSRLTQLDWRLRLVGDGPLESTVRSQVERYGLGSRVEFAGVSTAVEQHLAESQIFALSTRFEGFPRSVLEAMRAGLPVVASQVGGVAEAVRPGHEGLLCQPGDVGAMAAALEALIAAPDMRARLGLAARRRYEAQFTFDKTYAATRDILMRAAFENSSRTLTRTANAETAAAG